jgi:type 1 glutamine amidotransferase/mono/diheme cytochrome c family protein
MHYSRLLVLSTTLLLLFTATNIRSETARKRIVMLAGKKSHGPVGNGIHDYGWSARLIKTMLDRSNVRDQIEVEVFLDGWPTDHSKLESADSIMIISDGRDGDLYEEALHLQDPETIAFISKQMERGCGLVTFHFSTFAPDRYADQILDWTGGYFDWETDGKKEWYSAIQTIDSTVELASPNHPISRGVKSFPLKEEFYFNLRFHPIASGIVPILKVPALPGRDERGRVVAWGRERTNHGRGFGTTCGHFYDNWKNDDFRKLILNGLVWSAHVEVPTEGVVSRFYSHDEIDAASKAPIDTPIRVLLLAGNDAHKWHNWEKTTPRIKEALQRDSRIVVEETNDPEDFARKRLGDYQAIVLNYCNWQDPRELSPAAKDAFTLYLKRGGGLVVIHFANGAFHYSLPQASASDWPEYRHIVRRVWDHTNQNGVTSGHDAFGPFQVNITESPHPITEGLSSFNIVDELYFQQVGDEPIEPLITAHSKVTGKDEPLAFAYRYGDGHVFQTLLGHSEKTYDAFEAREMIRRAVAWVSKSPVHPIPKENDPNPVPPETVRTETLVPGRFGQALNARVAHAFAPPIPECRDRPLTVECWVKLANHTSYNIILGSEIKASPFHWSLFTEPGSGAPTMYFPTRSPDHVRSNTNICDDKWHYVAATIELDRIRIFVDGKLAAESPIKFSESKFDRTGFAIGGLVEKGIGCEGLIDEVRVSQGIRDLSNVPSKALTSDDSTIALWHFDRIDEKKKTPDESSHQRSLKLRSASEPADASTKTPSADPHFDKGSVGFHWKEEDSADNRWNEADIGPFLASSIPLPNEPTVQKGLSIRVGDQASAAVLYDTATMDWRAGWSGEFLRFSPIRHGLISTPEIAGSVRLVSKANPSNATRHYVRLSQSGERVVLEYEIGTTRVCEHPWAATTEIGPIFRRSFEVHGAKDSVKLPIGTWSGEVQTKRSDSLSWFEIADGEERLVIAVKGAAPDVSVSNDQTTILTQCPVSAELHYFDVFLWKGKEQSVPSLVNQIEQMPETDWDRLRQPAKVWKDNIVTHGSVGTSDGPFAVDNLPLPTKNSYRSLCFASAHDFLSNGQIAVSMVHGDVWIASGIDEDLRDLTWTRFATGLFQPLGLRVVNDEIYVLGRDQITKIIDRNRDGEADSYEVVSNAYETSPKGHDYVTCLETDAEGRFYFLHANQGLLRLNPNDKSVEVLATGLRNPNGLSISSSGIVTASPQEGNWTPTSSIVELRNGAYYGYPGEEHLQDPPRPYTPPLCWIPRLMDNSSGGQVWIDSNRWGVLNGGMLHLSYGQCKLLYALRETVGDAVQGGVVTLPIDFRSGIMRGRFSPIDQHLYLSGLKGWVSSAVDDGCLVRVRPTGKPIDLPIRVETLKNGMLIHFTTPLDKAAAEDLDRYDLTQWNYLYSMNYGSDEYSVSDPTRVGRDEVDVISATLQPDGRSVFLEIPDFKPVMQMSIHFKLETADHRPFEQTIAYTINKVGDRQQDESYIVRRPRKGQLSPEIEASLRTGLKLSFNDDHVISRQLAWAVPSLTSATLQTRPGQTAESMKVKFSGYLKVARAGNYQFKLEGTSTARLELGENTGSSFDLSVNGEPVQLALRKGYHPIRVTTTWAAEPPRSLRILWQGEAFAWEPLPATQLFHDGRDADLAKSTEWRTGYRLYQERGCARCHDGGERAASIGPDWSEIGSRLDKNWITHWLLDPKSIRPQTAMPQFFNPASEIDRQSAADIAEYLGSLTTTSGDTQVHDPGNAEEGLALYEDLGCLACHHREEIGADDTERRIPLRGIARKFRPGKLAEFLAEPTAHSIRTRMPNFKLTSKEAADLASFIRELPFSPSREFPTGDRERGRLAVQTRRCTACHQSRDIEQSTVASLAINNPENGCLSAMSSGKNGLQFSFNDEERSALVSYVRSRTGTPETHTMPIAFADSARHLTEKLRCHACHSRDGKPSPRGLLFQDESETGLPPETIPDLTWGGEKLRTEWVRDLLAGKLPYRSRPWLRARMPAFPAYAEELAIGLAAEHGLLPSTDPATEIDDELVETGRQLVGLSTGLDCRQCHAIGSEEPQGDDRTKISLGINFVHVRDRMRGEHYRRFVLDPPRFDIATRMPKLAPDGRTTKIKSVYDGDASKQFEAIWQFIQSLPVENASIENAANE